MNKMNTAIIAVLSIVIFSISIVAIPLNIANATTASSQGYFTSGRQVGATSAAVTKTIRVNGADEMAVYVSTTGNFSNGNLITQVSIDETNWITVDTNPLGTNSSELVKYGANNPSLTTVKLNPLLFPFMKIYVSAGVTGAVQTLTWSGVRDTPN